MNLLESLIVIETARRDAWLSRDKEKLAALLDEDFLEINYFGRLSKAELLGEFFDRLLLKSFTIEDPDLRGTPDAPILIYTCRECLSVEGNEIQGTFSVSSHFVRRDSDWKILLWQITPAK